MALPTIRLRHSVSSILSVSASLGALRRSLYKKTPKSLAEIGRELNVQFVVEGAVRSEGRLLRTRCTLNRASDQVQLWSESFDRELTSLLDVQRELSVVDRGSGPAPALSRTAGVDCSTPYSGRGCIRFLPTRPATVESADASEHAHGDRVLHPRDRHRSQLRASLGRHRRSALQGPPSMPTRTRS